MQMKKSNIYIGEIIKNVMSERQVTKAELARRLDVKPQDEIIKLNLKKKIAELLDGGANK